MVIKCRRKVQTNTDFWIYITKLLKKHDMHIMVPVFVGEPEFVPYHNKIPQVYSRRI